LISDLKAQIQKELATGLPQTDLNALQKALDKSGKDQVPFDEIINEVGGASRMKLMDTGSLNRKLAVLKGLETWEWTLSEGPTGAGRARYGLAINGTEKRKIEQRTAT